MSRVDLNVFVITLLTLYMFGSSVVKLLTFYVFRSSVMKFNPISDGILCHCVGSLSPEGHASRHTAPRDKIYQERLYFYLLGSQNVSRPCCLNLIRNISKNAESSSSCSSRTGQSLASSQLYQQRTSPTSPVSGTRGLLDQGSSKTTRTRTLQRSLQETTGTALC